MKIALLSFEFPPETGFGGIGTYTWHHARALATLGHDVHVLAGSRTPMAISSHEQDGVVVHRFWADGVAMRAAGWAGKAGYWWTRQRLQNAWSMYRGIAPLHRRHRFDILEMPECGGEGALITTRLNAPTVVRLHSPSRLIMPFYDVQPLDVRLCSAIEERAMVHATALTSCSRFLAREVADPPGLERDITVITNGLDLEWFDHAATQTDVYADYGLPKRQLLIVFTGRLERRKGVHLLAEIAGSILERHDVTFAIAGDDLFGYAASTLLPSLAAKRLKGSIHCLGALPLSGVRQLVAAADVFLLPSLWENCPYSCLEAMAAGRTVVASDQGGMPELITHGVNGLLAATGDASAFTRQLDVAIDDAVLRQRLGAAARRTIEQSHSATDTARQSVQAYEEIIRRRSA